MSITVNEALQLPDIAQIKLVGGQGGLHRTIKWVTIVEIIEDVTRLQEGEFLITTGFGLDTKKNRRHFIERLARQKLSAVAIHTGFYMERIPEEFINAANTFHLPLIEIPKHMNFSEVTKVLLTHIVNNQLKMAEEIQAIHHKLTNLILRNKGLGAVAALLAELLEADVFIFDAFHTLVESSCANDEAIESGFLLEQDVPASLEKPLLLSAHRLVYPIAVENYYGCLYVVKSSNLPPLTEMDVMIIEQAGTVCAIDFLKQRAVDEVWLRLQGDFLDELLETDIRDKAYIYKQARKLGYDMNGQIAVIRIAAEGDEDVLSVVQQAVKKFPSPALVREKMNALVLMVKPVNGSQSISDLVKEITDQWQLRYPTALYVGSSSISDDITQLSERSREARYALHVARLTGIRHMPYEKIGVYEALLQMKDAGVSLSSLYEKLLAPLLHYDAKHHSRLLETLECYIRHNMNMKNTAASLFVHRHTLKYRLEQIQAKTGKTLEHADTLFQFHLAIMAYRIDQTAKQSAIIR